MRYHLSSPSVLEGKVCSSFLNRECVSTAVGSFEGLVVIVLGCIGVRRGVLRLGLIASM